MISQVGAGVEFELLKQQFTNFRMSKPATFIPEEKINGLEIPNGLPLIYDMNSKCVKLLDDGTTDDPLEKYNFGASASYLFKPCIDDEGCGFTFLNEDLELSESDQSLIDSIKSPTAAV